MTSVTGKKNPTPKKPRAKKPVNLETLTTKAKMGTAFLRYAALDDLARDSMIAAGFGNARPSDVEKAIRENNFPRGSEALWRERAEITATLNALRYLSELRFNLHPLDLPGVRDKYYAQYEKRPKKYAGETSVTGKKNPTPKSESVSTVYLEGIKEGRDELKALRREFPEWTDAVIMSERGPRNIEVAEKLLTRVEPGSSNADFIRGQLDFWRNQMKSRAVVQITGKKNPVARPMKRKHPIVRKAAPSASHLIRAHHENGTIYFLTAGSKLSTEKKDAERFTHDVVDRTMNWLEDRLPKTIKYVDAVKA